MPNRETEEKNVVKAEMERRLAATRMRLHALVVEAVVVAKRLDDPHLNEYIKAAAYRAADDILGVKWGFVYISLWTAMDAHTSQRYPMKNPKPKQIGPINYDCPKCGTLANLVWRGWACPKCHELLDTIERKKLHEKSR